MNIIRKLFFLSSIFVICQLNNYSAEATAKKKAIATDSKKNNKDYTVKTTVKYIPCNKMIVGLSAGIIIGVSLTAVACKVMKPKFLGYSDTTTA